MHCREKQNKNVGIGVKLIWIQVVDHSTFSLLFGKSLISLSLLFVIDFLKINVVKSMTKLLTLNSAQNIGDISKWPLQGSL